MKLIAERKIDELGRIVLPAVIRQRLGITVKSTVAIYEDGGAIVMKTAEPCCKLCGGNDRVNDELHLCTECIDRVKSY